MGMHVKISGTIAVPLNQCNIPKNILCIKLWSGTHTSVTGSVSSVMFRQTDLENNGYSSSDSSVTRFSQISLQSVQSSQFSQFRQTTCTAVNFSQVQSACVQSGSVSLCGGGTRALAIYVWYGYLVASL
jgi:hypothetical protein